jgi:2-oxoglutarate ferredoxin oxidoreductase subunit gamma
VEQSVIIAGFGGQGVILAGKILAQAGMDEGLEVTWLPSYGPEMRGGTANCTVVLGDEPIGSPVVDEPSAVIALNRPSLERFEPQVAANGTLIVNRSLIDIPVKRQDLSVRDVPLSDLASKAGSARTLNMVALGALVRSTGVVSLDAVRAAMTTMLTETGKESFVEVNAKALQEGFDAVGS